MESVTEADVLIAGAGPVGLSLAIELGQRGITCLAVERNDRVGYSPRAKTTNVRTASTYAAGALPMRSAKRHRFRPTIHPPLCSPPE